MGRICTYLQLYKVLGLLEEVLGLLEEVLGLLEEVLGLLEEVLVSTFFFWFQPDQWDFGSTMSM